ncbi:succinate dehydrogenase cytochrome b560 subunit, mitochondrial-like [Leguminivora glycinivorella]|uniref:succinate dehydrogenase cytochrome b560 subunit, mitochondrial-like n=1 Tax=Leguminivora glycinivorella TaxID=1035111 RepID=UPI00200F9616|nr:succinate dehydrogenase cytochrome b560 subunit, mitochondrial-like [Leguminivora glycinivorella]XP_047990408.1 succinate dehydrogenase cytochrome b560 subunit, mitochondrial-like [Leguminivora glycinivorella]
MAFYCTGRLGAKSMISNLNRLPSLLGTAQYAQAASVPKISFKKFEPLNVEHHDIRNERLKRPLSPHLTIYSFPLPAMLSITHRATGIMLSGYATVLGVGALALPHDVSHYITMIEGLNLSPATLFLAKSVIAAPFAYHFANGLRHLYWDTAKGLSIKEVYTSGYAVLAMATIITLILAAL